MIKPKPKNKEEYRIARDKVVRMIYISKEVDEYLSKVNASHLVNKLVKEKISKG